MKTSRNVVKLISNSMEKWKTRLECDGNALGTVNIKRGIFQGDSLSPLLFCDDTGSTHTNIETNESWILLQKLNKNQPPSLHG